MKEGVSVRVCILREGCYEPCYARKLRGKTTSSGNLLFMNEDMDDIVGGKTFEPPNPRRAGHDQTGPTVFDFVFFARVVPRPTS